jgi:hypothetical protein
MIFIRVKDGQEIDLDLPDKIGVVVSEDHGDMTTFYIHEVTPDSPEWPDAVERWAIMKGLLTPEMGARFV